MLGITRRGVKKLLEEVSTTLTSAFNTALGELKTINNISLLGGGNIVIIPTTEGVTNALKGLSVGGVGTHAFLCEIGTNKSARDNGDLLSGSSLRYAGVNNNTSIHLSNDVTVSGTWKLLGAYDTTTSYNDNVMSLWLRVA